MESWIATTRAGLVTMVACLCGLLSAVPAAGAATTIDFTQDAGGSTPNGFQSVASDQVAFTDSDGADLEVGDFLGQSNGQALAVFGEDASELVMDFAVPMQAVSLAFGNDDPSAMSGTDRAALRVFESGAEVGIATEPLNGNDVMDQTVSYTGPSCFTQATFRYETTAGAPMNLLEIVDDVAFEPCTAETDVGSDFGGTSAQPCTVTKATAYDDPDRRVAPYVVLGSQALAQSFRVPSDTVLSKVSLAAYNHNSSEDFTAEIHSDSAGVPGPLLGTRTRKLSAEVDQFADFDFSADDIPLVAGATYYIVGKSPGTNLYVWWGDDLYPTYPYGTVYSSTNGGPWAPSDADLLFQVWGGRTCPIVDTRNPPAPALDTTAPVIMKSRLSSSLFHVDTKAKASKTPKGTRLRFNLSEPATVVFVTEQRVGKRWRKIRIFGKRFAGGRNALDYSGKIKPRGKQRALRPGRYRLRMRPSDRAGNRGKLTTAGFKIVK